MHNPPHAGEILADIIKDLDIDIRELARTLAILAIKLSAVIGSTPAMWLRIQAACDLDRAAKTVDLSVLNTRFKPGPLHGVN